MTDTWQPCAEKVDGESLTQRAAMLGLIAVAFLSHAAACSSSLGIADLCHCSWDVLQSSGLLSRATRQDLGEYHFVFGADVSGPAAIAAYFRPLLDGRSVSCCARVVSVWRWLCECERVL